jgi:hypothetical protein
MTTANPSDAARASHKKDREAIAACFVAIAEKHGAAIERRDEPRTLGHCGAGIQLSFTLNGTGAMVSVNDLHGGDSALISWYPDYVRGYCGPVRNYTSAFNVAVGDLLKTWPHHKATSSGTWDQLARYLDAGLAMAAAGNSWAA